jgi:hypothetical protein
MIGPTLLAGILIIMIFILVRMGFFDAVGDFAGSLYGGLKNAVGTLVDTAKNWSQGSYLAPGMRYCGPGNPLNNGEPVDASDAACRAHDYEYDAFKKQKDAGRINANELRSLVRESDDRLINNLRAASGRGIGSHMAELAIKAKKRLEDWGWMDPAKFVT